MRKLLVQSQEKSISLCGFIFMIISEIILHITAVFYC